MGFAQPVEDILAESYRTGCKYKYLYTRDGCRQGGKRLGDETSASEQKGVMQWTGIKLGAR